MPTYEYRCHACDNKWEEFQSIKAEPTKKCPKCKKAKAERIISAGGGILFKGTGFYQTDYRSESYKKAQAADAEKAKPADAKSDTKSDSKPDTKPDAKPEAKPEPKAESKAPAKIESKSASKSAAKPSSKPARKAKR